MKKTLSTLFVFVFLAVICSCSPKNDGSDAGESSESITYNGVVPEYFSDDEFYIGMWVGPPTEFVEYDEDKKPVSTRAVTDEDYERHYKLIKEAGFGYVDCGLGQTSESYYIKMLPFAEKYGLKQYVYDGTVNRLLSDAEAEDEILVRDVKKALAKYTKYSSFAGLRIKDEPSYNEIAAFGRGSKIFKQACPGAYYYINLFPTYASPSLINNDYVSYIKKYVEEIDSPFISYDFYAMKGNGKVNTVADSFLYNMLEVRNAAKNKEMWTFLQAIKYGSRNRALTSVADATFQAYSFLAFGGKGIQWFCYFSPPPHTESFGEGCIGWNGEPTAVYDYVKTANLELRDLQSVYFNFEWKGFMLNGENENFGLVKGRSGYIAEHPGIKSFVAEKDTLTGVFKGTDGRDGFMIVNFTEPSGGLSDKVSVTFNGATGALVYKHGKPEVVGLKNGKLDIELGAGEGYFVIPLA